jgi:TlyA family rRNA methyltransferase/putative hemolysin
MRLDQFLFEKGLFDSREKARREILAGRVKKKGSGEILDKPGTRVSKDLEIELEVRQRFVGRAGDKLQGFLDDSKLSVVGFKCLDVGSSTGGFTDCLLQNGCEQVWAVDVGRHQMHEKLRQDARVHLFEECDIRDFDFSLISNEMDLVVIDVSFISIKKFMALLVRSLPRARFLILFKPQFEAGRGQHGKHGIIEEESRRHVLEEMLLYLKSLSLNLEMVQESSVKGMKGNQETFILAQKRAPQSIFRAYDIRGHAEKELSEEVFEKVGFILGSRLRKKFPMKALRVGVGRDGRPSSPRLTEALRRGLCRHSLDLVDLGLTTTPMLYFSKFCFSLDAAFQITASHNPSHDNGLKMMIGESTLFGEEIASLGEEVGALSLPVFEDLSQSFDRHSELLQKYVQFLHEQFSGIKKFKVVLDCANGMAGLVAREIFSKLSHTLEIIYEEVDCRFPNHPADPTVEDNLKDLKLRVADLGADIGFAFDGDADRLGVVSAKGRVLWGDEILMLLSERVLSQNPGASIIGEVKCSERLFQHVRQKGGVPVMYKTGHSLIKKKMKDLDAPLAGEMSGHLFFSDRYFGFDDASYAALRVLEVLSELPQGLDAWIESIPSAFITPEMRFDCRGSEKIDLIDKVKMFYSGKEGVNVNPLDGVRVSFSDHSWLLVRASNTQDVLVVRVEASSESRLAELKAELGQLLGRVLG